MTYFAAAATTAAAASALLASETLVRHRAQFVEALVHDVLCCSTACNDSIKLTFKYPFFEGAVSEKQRSL